MKTFKVVKEKSGIILTDIDGEIVQRFRGYLIGDLPRTFGCLEYGFKVYDEENNRIHSDEPSDGVPEWFNWKGLTYLKAD
jgi:hypothetical protein